MVHIAEKCQYLPSPNISLVYVLLVTSVKFRLFEKEIDLLIMGYSLESQVRGQTQFQCEKMQDFMSLSELRYLRKQWLFFGVSRNTFQI